MDLVKEGLEQAHLHLAQGNTHHAKQLLETLLNTHPDNDPVLRTLAHCHNRLGDHHQALHYFQAAYTLTPNDPNLPIRISEQLRTLQRFDEAQHHLTHTLTQHPNSLPAHLEQAHLHLAQGNTHHAKQLLETLLNTHPDNDPVLRTLAHCHNRLGDHHQALHYFQAAYTLTPNDPNLPIRISEQLRTLQRFDEAQHHLTHTLTQHPNSLPAHLEQAHLHLAQGNTHHAKQLLETLLNTHPDNDPVLRTLAHCHNRLGDHHQALHYFQAAYTLTPNDPNLPIRISEQLRTLQRFDEAQHHLTHTLTQHPNSLPAHLEQAHLHLAQGNTHHAKQLLEWLIDCFGEHVIQFPASIRLLCVVGNSRSALRKMICHRAAISAPHSQTYCQLAINWHSPRLGEILLNYLRHKGSVSPADDLRIRAAIAFANSQFSHSQNLLLKIPTAEWRPSDTHQFKEAAIADLNPRAVTLIDRRIGGQRGGDSPSFSQSAQRVGSRLNRGFLNDIANELALSEVDSHSEDGSLRHGIHSINQFIKESAKSSDQNVNPQSVPSTLTSFGLTQVWLGDQVPESVLQMHQHWKEFYPQSRCTLLVNDDAYELVRSHSSPRVVDDLRRLPHHAARADLIRLVVLKVFGGTWSDVDDLPIQDPSSWLPEADLVVFKEDRGNLGNNFIAARPQHPAIERALDWGIEACRHGFSESIWLATGPGLLTRAVGSWIHSERGKLNPDSLHIFTSHQIRRYVSFGVPLNYKSTLSSWQRAERHIA